MKTVLIEGMMCERCVSHAKKALEALGSEVNVSLALNKATLNTNASDQEIIEAIENAGYEVKEIING